ncbi:Actin cytoskeleton-regulatory complex protein PAN1 [Bienertia sinuspersici]
MWLNEDSSVEVVEKAWQKGMEASWNIAKTATALSSWSKETFGNTAKELRDCQNQIRRLMEKEQTKEDLFSSRSQIDVAPVINIV